MPAQREEPHGPGTRWAPGSAHEMLRGYRGSSSALRIDFHSIGMDHEGSRPDL